VLLLDGPESNPDYLRHSMEILQNIYPAFKRDMNWTFSPRAMPQLWHMHKILLMHFSPFQVDIYIWGDIWSNNTFQMKTLTFKGINFSQNKLKMLLLSCLLSPRDIALFAIYIYMLISITVYLPEGSVFHDYLFNPFSLNGNKVRNRIKLL